MSAGYHHDLDIDQATSFGGFWISLKEIFRQTNGTRDSRILSKLKRLIGLLLLAGIKFCYGFIFGTAMWWVMVHPYQQFFDFETKSYLPEFLFSLISALIFMSFRLVRSIMVLFLPNMFGNATQNVVLIAIVVALFNGPITNIALNAAESTRIIGCSLVMTFESLKERSKLILSPVLELINDTNNTEIEPIKQDLLEIQKLALDLANEAELDFKSDLEYNRKQAIKTGVLQANTKDTSVGDIAKDLGDRLNMSEDARLTKKLAAKTKQLMSDSVVSGQLIMGEENIGIKIGLNVGKLDRQFGDPAQMLAARSSNFNLTNVLYENCLGIFRRAKLSCGEAVESMRDSCKQTIGPILATLWCSPISMPLDALCPYVMNQILDENSLCNQMRETTLKVHIDPFNITGGADIDTTYRDLTKKLVSLTSNNDDGLHNQQSRKALSQERQDRVELLISFDDPTLRVFFKARNLLRFLQDKYRMRHALFMVLKFIYEIYTSIAFVCILRQAYKYRANYLQSIRFDNHYITGLFVALDKQKCRLGKPSVLPLTRDESRTYLSTFTCRRRTEEEQRVQRSSCAIISLFMVFCLLLVYFDDIFNSMLRSVHEHALIRFREIGHHELNISVKGEGAIARLVRKLTQRLNSAHDLNRRTTTERCLPETLITGWTFYGNFLYLVGVYLLIDQLNIYAMRLRRPSIAFFYPDRERARIDFIHKQILAERKQLMRAGLASYLSLDSEETDSSWVPVYTAKDAIGYLSKCVSSSWSCCVDNIMCCNKRRPDRSHHYTRLSR